MGKLRSTGQMRPFSLIIPARQTIYLNFEFIFKETIKINCIVCTHLIHCQNLEKIAPKHKELTNPLLQSQDRCGVTYTTLA